MCLRRLCQQRVALLSERSPAQVCKPQVCSGRLTTYMACHSQARVSISREVQVEAIYVCTYMRVSFVFHPAAIDQGSAGYGSIMGKQLYKQALYVYTTGLACIYIV